MDKAFDFLEIQKQALESQSVEALGFILTNQTLKLLPYKQAVFWTGEPNAPQLKTVSGNAVIEEKSPYALWMKKVIREYKHVDENPVTLKKSEITHNDAEKKWCAKHVLIFQLSGLNGRPAGGLWIERDKAFEPIEIGLLGELKPAWETKLALFQKQEKGGVLSSWTGLQKRKKYILGALIFLALFPVRLKITAPAEIVAQEKMVASAPFDGIVKEIRVSPGESVQKGQILAEMESEELKAQAAAATKTLETAQSSLSRLKRAAIADPEKKAELNLLQSEIEAKKIEYRYAQERLDRAEIKSPRDGIAVLSDISQFNDKPVVTGEPLIEVAAPEDIELLVRIPVDAMIDFSKSAPVAFYANISPLSRIDAKIETIGYQASPDSDGLLTYKLRAIPQDNVQNLRIGWKGTAKIYGDWTILSYAILRRPLITLRRLSGGI